MAGSLSGVAHAVPAADRIGVHNTRELRAAGPASSGGVASLYAACLVDNPIPAERTQIHSVGYDLVMGRPSRFGLGYQLPDENQPYLSARAFGHDGAGGCWGFADPRTGVATTVPSTFAISGSFPQILVS